MTLPLDARPYSVRPGDNLAAIAKVQGYRDWKVIYQSRCNQRLRQIRPDPNLIKPGDVVMLPPRPSDVRATLEQRLNKLLQVRRQTEELFGQVARDLDQSFTKVKHTAQAVDTTAEVLMIFKTLTKMCWKGYKATQLAGEELEKANKEMAKEAIDFAKDKPENVILETFAEQLDRPQSVQITNSALWVFSAVVVKSWLDINSPSFWAGAIAQYRSGASFQTAVTRRPEDIHASAKSGLERTRANALQQLDTKISETRRLLGLFSGEVSQPLPLK